MAMCPVLSLSFPGSSLLFYNHPLFAWNNILSSDILAAAHEGPLLQINILF